jgi:guanylate kinase
LRTYFNDVKAEIKKEHSNYIAKHPELREILNDFLSTVMLEKPSNIYDYAQQYFSYYNIENDKVLMNPLVISGPSGSGKVVVVCNVIESLLIHSLIRER